MKHEGETLRKKTSEEVEEEVGREKKGGDVDAD
jgi:hypothetical protein